MGSSRYFEIRTRNREEAAESLNRVAVHRPRMRFDDTEAGGVSLRTANYDGLGADLIRFGGMHYAAAVEPVDFLLAGFVADGRGVVHGRDDSAELPRHGGFLYPLGVEFAAEYDDASLATVRVPLDVIAPMAEAATGMPAADLRFEAVTPVSEAMRHYWAGTAVHLTRHLAVPDADLPPLLLDQLRRLAGASMLTVFPNTTMTAARLPEPGRIPPAAVRRAVAYMDAHADEPLTAATIAAAAGIGVRGLQVAFRRHLDQTPLEYLRRVRLERVHRELQAAEPGAGVTVKAIARRWGFANPGRFTAEYRAVYGHLPSRTLRT
ncbi:helix-turn-helix domain-containing protein [Dactylosporangium sp. CA-139114]|uniref:helix-turn-helix domain-containing protein n=1 Tax=Dactylosporangium sp. CA-139114 TaxID=3239931 RepID=UPI003D99B834